MRILTSCTNLFLMVLVPLNIVSQSYSVRKFTTTHGLLSNSINDCNYDNNGFLWIATQAGLSRFDGRKFKNFTSNTNLNIKSNRFKAIFRQSNGNLFVKNSIQQLFFINDFSELVLLDNFKYGEDYIETSDRKIVFFKKNDPLKTKIDPLGWESQFLLYITQDKNIYQIYDSCIIYNKTTKLPFINHSKRPTVSFINGNKFYTINKNKQLLVFSKGKLVQTYQINTLLNQNADFNNYFVFSNNDLHTLNVNNQLYTITEKNNELKFTKLNIALNENELLTKVNFSHPNLSVFYSGINGVYFVQPQLLNTKGLNSIEKGNNGTYRLLLRKNNEVISSAYFNSITHLNGAQSNISLTFNIGVDTICSVFDNTINYSVNDKVFKYQLEYTKNSPQKNEIKDVLIANNKVYLTSKQLVFELTKPNKLTPLVYSPSDITTVCLMEDKKHWLIGTSNDGIYRYNSINKSYSVLKYFINKDIRSIKYDNAINKYWVFTYGSGIHWLDTQLKAIPFQKVNNNFLDFAHYYLKDTIGNYWIPSNNGLFRYEKKEILKLSKQNNFKLHYQYFSNENGLNGNEFNGGYYNSGLALPNGYLAFSSKEGVVSLNPYQVQMENNTYPILIDEVLINQIPSPISAFYKFKERYFSFEMIISSPNFNFGMSSNIEYQIPELNINWESLEDHKLKLYSLKSGEYHIYIRKTGDLNTKNYKVVTLEVLPPWHASSLAIIMYLLLGLFIFVLVERFISKHRQEKIKTNLQLIESELKALRAQINPHYLSNSLIGLQNSIMDGNYEKSVKFISTFSKVMRNILFNSEKSISSVENEIKIIKDYIALENINREQYVQLQISKEFTAFHKLSEIYIPTNVLQPLVENALIHGFSESLNRSLFIQIKINVTFDNLLIEIIDNGKGYQPVAKKSDSFGLKNLKLVIQQLQFKFNKTVNIEIANRIDAQGTIVHLTLPLITNNNDKKQA
jgi:uncharacterized membrane-anchored protein YhcB (DUF1043 family)